MALARPKAGRDYPHNWSKFLELFSSEEDCFAYLERVRWGKSFDCPACGGMIEQLDQLEEAKHPSAFSPTALRLWEQCQRSYAHAYLLKTEVDDPAIAASRLRQRVARGAGGGPPRSTTLVRVIDTLVLSHG